MRRIEVTSRCAPFLCDARFLLGFTSMILLEFRFHINAVYARVQNVTRACKTVKNKTKQSSVSSMYAQGWRVPNC